jgi:hypothetical protein
MLKKPYTDIIPNFLTGKFGIFFALIEPQFALLRPWSYCNE